MKNEDLERALMGAEDFDAPGMEQVQEQQEQYPHSWQIYHDDSTDPPTPWWFNPHTGVSTWECPVVAEEKDGPPEAAAGEKALRVQFEMISTDFGDNRCAACHWYKRITPVDPKPTSSLHLPCRIMATDTILVLTCVKQFWYGMRGLPH